MTPLMVTEVFTAVVKSLHMLLIFHRGTKIAACVRTSTSALDNQKNASPQMIKRLLSHLVIATAAVLGISSAAVAEPVAFIPPNDPVGKVFTTGVNDDYSQGRGIAFTVSSGQTLSSVGLFTDITDITLNVGVYTISSLTGILTRLTTLATASALVSTNGLEWIDFDIPDIDLNVGTNYLVEFTHTGVVNQAFYYNNMNVHWNQGAYMGLDGTSGSFGFPNSVVAAIRVNALDDVNGVPEPGSLALLGLGLAGLAAIRKRKQA